MLVEGVKCMHWVDTDTFKGKCHNLDFPTDWSPSSFSSEILLSVEYHCFYSVLLPAKPQVMLCSRKWLKKCSHFRTIINIAWKRQQLPAHICWVGHPKHLLNLACMVSAFMRKSLPYISVNTANPLYHKDIIMYHMPKSHFAAAYSSHFLI